MKSTLTIYPDGWRSYRDEKGYYHREDGPALFNDYRIDNEYWYYDVKLHRLDGPAAIYNLSKIKSYYIHGNCHRADGPAIERENGNNEYWYNNINYPNIKNNNEWLRFTKLIPFI